jgi:outer membrane protein OmpA-like peptidoglycan-associated protein
MKNKLIESEIRKMMNLIDYKVGMTITEQTGEVLVNNLNDKIKSVMVKNQNEILSDVKVEVRKSENGDNLVLIFAAENESPFKIKLIPSKYSSAVYLKDDKFNLVIPSIPLSDFYDEIWEGDEDLKRYYQENENIKKQMDNLKVPIRMYSDPIAEFEITIVGNDKKNRRSDDYVMGARTNLGFFFSNNGAKFGVSDNIILNTEVGGLQVKLGKVNILPPAPPEDETVTPEFASETIKLDLVDVFKFDSIDMNYPSGYQDVLKKFKTDLNNALENLKGFEEFLKTQNLVVNGYASRDNDPNEEVQGKFSGCRGYGDGSRGQYNLCLSEARAKKVAEDLQKIFDSLNINVDIKSKGYGETDKFGPAWSKEKPTQPKDTQANRRITFNIPKYTETIKK